MSPMLERTSPEPDAPVSVSVSVSGSESVPVPGPETERGPGYCQARTCFSMPTAKSAASGDIGLASTILILDQTSMRCSMVTAKSLCKG